MDSVQYVVSEVLMVVILWGQLDWTNVWEEPAASIFRAKCKPMMFSLLSFTSYCFTQIPYFLFYIILYFCSSHFIPLLLGPLNQSLLVFYLFSHLLCLWKLAIFLYSISPDFPLPPTSSLRAKISCIHSACWKLPLKGPVFLHPSSYPH